MTIEEKSKALEFTFSPDKDSNIKYEIVYDPEQEEHPLTVNFDRMRMIMPVELFTEVVDFLRSKGVIKSSLLPINTNTTASTIPLPVIDGEENNEIEQKEKQIAAGPITSFDTSVETEEIVKEIIEEDISEKEKNIVIKENKKKEDIPNRTVIKTKKFNKDDPRGAEREAAESRGNKESNFKRVE